MPPTVVADEAVEMVTCTARQFFKAAGLLSTTAVAQGHGDHIDTTS